MNIILKKYYLKGGTYSRPHLVVSNNEWVNYPETGYGQALFGCVTLRRLCHGKFELSRDDHEHRLIFEVRRDEVPNGMNRQCFRNSVVLDDGDVFAIGIDHFKWNSVGDTGRKNEF